ncbi:MAG: amidohydrolase family protein, partial [Silicimonas sp.]|nr:amidohydrolase family protein [Silicimonas sp.]
AQVVFCDLTADDLGDTLDRFQTLPTVKGVRQIVGRAPGEDAVTGTNALLDDPRFIEGLREAGRRGFSFDLQLIPELYEQMGEILAEVPGTRVALCHAGSPHDRTPQGLAKWAKALRLLSNLNHVTCKLSGLGMFDHDWTPETIRPIVETCLDQFEPARCMFGSNFPVDSLYSNYATIVAAYEALVPKAAKSAVFGETAAGFYDLTPAP